MKTCLLSSRFSPARLLLAACLGLPALACGEPGSTGAAPPSAGQLPPGLIADPGPSLPIALVAAPPPLATLDPASVGPEQPENVILIAGGGAQ